MLRAVTALFLTLALALSCAAASAAGEAAGAIAIQSDESGATTIRADSRPDAPGDFAGGMALLDQLAQACADAMGSPVSEAKRALAAALAAGERAQLNGYSLRAEFHGADITITIARDENASPARLQPQKVGSIDEIAQGCAALLAEGERLSHRVTRSEEGCDVLMSAYVNESADPWLTAGALHAYFWQSARLSGIECHLMSAIIYDSAMTPVLAVGLTAAGADALWIPGGADTAPEELKTAIQRLDQPGMAVIADNTK